LTNWTHDQLAEVRQRMGQQPVPDPAVRRRREQPEQELQAAVVAHWRPRLVAGARLFATNGELPGGTKFFRQAAAKRSRMGYVRGTPDLCARRPGKLLWLELKVPPNTPTDEQAAWAEWAIEAGDGWAVVTSVGEAGVVLRAWGFVA
jgi:hypothetical protein